MVRWADFEAAEPALAQLGAERFEATGLSLLGTLRANGFPRISPVEPCLFAGELYLGMMWQSKKALDLLRDPRCAVHSTVSDKAGTEGDFKLYGRARDVQHADEREAVWDYEEERIGWRPTEEAHLFAISIVQVGWFQVIEGGGHDIRAWRA